MIKYLIGYFLTLTVSNAFVIFHQFGFNFSNDVIINSNSSNRECCKLYIPKNSKNTLVDDINDFLFGAKRRIGRVKHERTWCDEVAGEISSRSIFLNGTSLLLIDDFTPFMYHFFHFLEHIIPLHSVAASHQVNLDSVERVVFLNSNYITATGLQLQLNKQFLDLFFPTAKILDMEEWRKILCNHSEIILEKVISSDRRATMSASITKQWNKMMVGKYSML